MCEKQQLKLVHQSAQDKRDFGLSIAEVRELCDSTVVFEILQPAATPPPTHQGAASEPQEPEGEIVSTLGVDRAVVARSQVFQDALNAGQPQGPIRLRADLCAVLAWRAGPAALAALTMKQALQGLEVRRAC